MHRRRKRGRECDDTKNEKRGELDRRELPLFRWFFHSEVFYDQVGGDVGGNKRASDRHRRPVLTSETTKRKNSNIFSLLSILSLH